MIMTSHLLKKPSLLIISALLLIMLAAMMSGCGAKATPAPTPTKTPVPPTWTPTPTPLPPTDTPAPPPTATPAPTDTATPESTATPKPAYVNPQTDSGVSFLTGLKPADPSVLQRRPLAIKVANQKSVIPQTGLSLADIVVESLVEFQQTRYTAIYQSQSAPRVGSIRSARLVDLEIPDIFDAILCFSGASEPVRQKLYHTPDLKGQILEQALNPTAFHRDPDIPVPDNLFASTDTLWAYSTRKGWNMPPNPPGGWVFSNSATADAPTATAIDIPYPTFPVRWAYDSASGKWLRWLNGQPHIDKGSGAQLSADNIVVIYAKHVKTLILEYGSEPMGANCSNCSVEVQIWNEGPVQIFRDGKMYEGKWIRTGRGQPFQIVFNDGSPIPLKPGNSWWQIVPTEMAVKVSS